MIRIGMPLIGGPNWMGGHNYQVNLARCIAAYGSDSVSLVIGCGEDANPSMIQSFSNIEKTTLVRSAAFNAERKLRSLASALFWGIDSAAWRLFSSHGVTAVFEPAHFYGWRLPVPSVAWMPDFQHRHMPQLFSRLAWLKREAGFRAQIRAGRRILLSSRDAEQDCLRLYPSAQGRTYVARFVAPFDAELSVDEARTVADDLGLPENFVYLPNQLWRHKNHACVIRALAEVHRRGSSLVVAATGKELDPRAPTHPQQLRAMIDAEGVRQSFRILGSQPFRTVQALMLSCSALLNPSYFEGWSTTVEEAKALGIPMILSDIAVHREQAENRASFFDPQSPSALADCLMRVQAMAPVERSAALATAALEAKQKSRDFAAHFISIFEHEK